MKPELEKKQKGELISYKDSSCLICGLNFVTSFLLSLHKRQIILCTDCAKELKARLKAVHD